MRLIDADKLDWWYKGRPIRKVLDEAPTIEAYPCTFCAYNPPSSRDGKPCSYCPATAKREDGDGG